MKKSRKKASEEKKKKSKHEVKTLLKSMGKKTRSKRSEHLKHQGVFTRLERLDDKGDVVLEWDPDAKENVTFRLTAKTLGYVGLAFNDKSHMKGADVVLAWVDDHTRVPFVIVSTLR